MQSTANGRVRRSEVELLQLVDRQAASGVSRREFCEQERINHTSFERWHRRLTAGAGFVEVSPLVRGSSSWVVEVELAGGTIVRVGR
jgi:hypothetical protein